MLKFDTKTNTYYLVCDICGYPFPTESLPARIVEDGVIEDLDCYEIGDGRIICKHCLDESYKWNAETFLDRAKKRRKKEIEDERNRQIRERIKIH